MLNFGMMVGHTIHQGFVLSQTDGITSIVSFANCGSRTVIPGGLRGPHTL